MGHVDKIEVSFGYVIYALTVPVVVVLTVEGCVFFGRRQHSSNVSVSDAIKLTLVRKPA